jgi:hypothetical protein
MPPPSGGSPGRKRAGTGRRGPIGCLIAAVVVLVAVAAGGYAFWKARQPDPAPLNADHRSPVGGYGYTFTMDGTVQIGFDGKRLEKMVPSEATMWHTSADTWEEAVLVVEVNLPAYDSTNAYEDGAQRIAGQIIGEFRPDVTDTSQVLGRRATEFQGWFQERDSRVRVGRTEVKRARVTVLVTTLDAHHLVAIAVAEDPKHPAPTEEITTIRRSFSRG